MKILVDADSCPRPVRELVLRASARTGIQAIFVANRPIPGLEAVAGARMELCPAGEGAADDRIVELACPGDLAITRDIPLAARLVEASILDASILVMDDRGRTYTRENIRERLSMRDFMLDLVRSGLHYSASASYGRRELKAFADAFSSAISRFFTSPPGPLPKAETKVRRLRE
jgi:uncharacterized protein YaiI (UPF0178 family)